MSLDDLVVKVLEAKYLAPMDKNGTSDPYCKLETDFGPQKYKTKVVPKNCNPEWKNETFKFINPKKDGHVTILCYDKDRITRDDFLGSVKVSVADLPLNKEVDQWYTLENEPKTPTRPKKEDKPATLRLLLTLSGKEEKKEKKAKSTTDAPKLEDTYEVGEELGRGGFSIVKKGTHKATKETVAIKVINKSDTPEDELELLYREIDIMKKLQHPHIVQLLDLYQTKDKLYLVLELVAGGELFDRIVERGHYTERDAADIVKQMLLGTKYMHENGVAHRDLKPENILCGGKNGEIVKIADFGLSKDFGQANLQTSLGTPGYVAPEVLSGNPYDNAVDLWSIGVITYVLLCGYTPFYADNQRELFEQILSADYSFPDPEWTDISDNAKDFIRNILVTNPNDRLTADTALDHPWIKSEAPDRELPQLQSFRNLKADQAKKNKQRQ